MARVGEWMTVLPCWIERSGGLPAGNNGGRVIQRALARNAFLL
jgi:hypothetical protein